MLFAVVFILEIVDCKPVSVENAGVVFNVTARPAEEAIMAGELDLDVEVGINDGDARLRLVTDGELFGPGEFTVTDEGELCRPEAVDGEFRITPVSVMVVDGELRRLEDGDARIAGELTRLGRQCFTESDPDWESLLLLGEPGEDTITWRGLRPPTAGGPTRGESGR